MSCSIFSKYQLGNISQRQFEKHLIQCADCQNAREEDSDLLEQVRSLRKPVEAPLLWERIETRLREEPFIPSPLKSEKKRKKTAPLLRFAAILIFAVGLAYLLWPKGNIRSSKLLADKTIQKVEKMEAAYVKAIASLESQVEPKKNQMDQDLYLLYRERLETIDFQIAQCQEALDRNPANGHIRRYMFAAFKDKKETLKEMLRRLL